LGFVLINDALPSSTLDVLLPGTDGVEPKAGLIFDATGNLYGITASGGAQLSYGTVFRLRPSKNGSWKEKVLHSFGKGNDGSIPLAGLIFGSDGHLYGTTSQGGAYSSACIYGCGTVFQLKPGKNGEWKEEVLHRFGDGKDGKFPLASLILDAAGKLFGTTQVGGAYGSRCSSTSRGTVFEVTP
jgi:uncharacterized repeat protein (TIGR03803 family)